MADQTSTLSVEVRTGQSVVELDKLKTSLGHVAVAAANVSNVAVVAQSVTRDVKAATSSITEYSSAMEVLERSTVAQTQAMSMLARAQTAHEKASKASHDRITANLLAARAIEAKADAGRVSQLAGIRTANERAAKSSQDRITANLMAARGAEVVAELERNSQLAQARAANEAAANASQSRITTKLLASRAAEVAAEATKNAQLIQARARNEASAKASHDRITAGTLAARAVEVQAEVERNNQLALVRASNEAASKASHDRITSNLLAARAEQKAIETKAHNERLTALHSHLAQMEAAERASHNRRMALLMSERAARVQNLAQTVSTNSAAGQTAHDRITANLLAERATKSAIAADPPSAANTSVERGNRLVKQNTSILRDNAAAMRDGHAVSRGLAGSLGTLWMTYGAIAPLMAGAAAGATLKAAYSAGSELEYRLRFIEALGNEAVKVKDLMPAVMNSMFKPVEVAEGLRQLTQAGLSTTQGLAALQPTLQLATMGEMSVSEAALTATSSISAFNLAITDASRVGDVFAKAAAVSNTDVKGIAEAMKQAATSSSLYGITMEETAAQLAVLAKRGIFGSAAGTAIKNFERELYAPIEKGRKALEKMGITAYDSVGKLRPFKDVMQDLVRTTSTMNDKNRSAFLKDVFNERGMRAAAILIDDYKGLLGSFDELESSQGFMARANELLIDTTQGAANRMASVLQQSMVKAFDNAEPDVRRAIQGLTELFGSDAFVGGVAKLAKGIANLTSTLADNWGTIGTVTAAYMSLRVVQSTGTALTALLERNERTLAAAKLGTAAASGVEASQIILSTRAKQMETVATVAGIKSKVAEQAAVTTSAATLGKWVGALGTIVKWFGWAGVALGTLTAVYQVFSASTSRVLADEEARANRIRSTTSAIDAQINALREKLRLENQSPVAQLADTRSESEKLRDEAERARERAKVARNEANLLGGYSNNTGGGAATLMGKDQRKARIAAERAYTLEVAAANAESAYTSKQVMLDMLQQTSDISDVTSKVTSAFKHNKDRIEEAWVDQGGKTVRWSGGDAILRQMEEVADKAKKSENVKEIESYYREMKSLEGKLQEVLPGHYATKEDKPARVGRTDRNSPEGLLDSALVKAGKLTLRETGDIQKANIKVVRDLEDAQKKLNEQYLTDDVIAGLRAREKAEDAFNSILDSRVSMIEEIRKGMEGVTDPKRLRMGESRIGALSSDLAAITLAQGAAGSKGEADGMAQYLRDNTAQSGVDKLFTKYRNEAMKTGDVVANALEMSFDRAGTALEEFAVTGKLNFRSFTVDILENLSKMAMKMATNQLFGMVIQMGMSAIGGAMGSGSQPVSYGNGAVPAQSFAVSAKGNAFSAGNMMKFAKGGAFTNNITTGTNVAPMSMFGEAGPEAILPLTRTANGDLGVRAVPAGMSNSSGSQQINITTNVVVNSDGSATSSTKEDTNMLSQFNAQLTGMVKDLIVRETRQGGSISRAIKGA